MFFKHAYTLALLLALVALFSILSGCGSNVSGGTLSAGYLRDGWQYAR